MVLKLERYVPLPQHQSGGFDHGDVYSANGYVYVAHTATGTVEIIDGLRGTHVKTIPGCPEASGVVCAQAEGLAFAASRGSGKILVINAAKAVFTGRKREKKVYYHHTGYIGHMRSATAGEMLAKHPERVIEEAVYGMLPGNKLRDQFMKKLKVFAGAEHPHAAQQPEKMEIRTNG